MTSINPPDGYTAVWGQQKDDRTIWLGAGYIPEHMARKSGRAVVRYISPVIPVQDGGDEAAI